MERRSPSGSPGHGQHESPRNGGTWQSIRRPAVVIGLVLGVVGLAYAWAIYSTASDGERSPALPPPATAGTGPATAAPTTSPPAPTTSPAATAPLTGTARPAVTTTGSATQDALVAAARAVKPLADLEPGDRVLYRGEVWYWRGWDRRPDLSWISTSPDDPDRLQVQTALLTPVEAAAGR